jgi:hypothetical protein
LDEEPRDRVREVQGGGVMAKGITIPRDLFESIAFRQLPLLEYRLLIELIALQQDSKTDGVQCSARWGAKVCGMQKSAAHDALQCLEERGFIVRVGSSGRGGAAHWRITSLPFLGEPPTREYSDTSLTWRSVQLKQAREVRGKPFFTPEMDGGSTGGNVVLFKEKRASK